MNLIYDVYLASLSLYAIFCFAPVQFHQLFGTRNERNSIRNIEVNVPSREVSKATVCTSRHRRGGTGGRREREREVLRRWRMHSNGSRDKEQDQCDSQLSPGLRTRFSYVVLTFLLTNVVVATSKRGWSLKRIQIDLHFTVLIIVN